MGGVHFKAFVCFDFFVAVFIGWKFVFGRESRDERGE